MKKNTISVAAILVVLSAVWVGIGFMDAHLAGAQGAVGTGFTYQGQLLRAGEPVDGITCDLQFSLYDAATAGTQSGATVTKTDIPITNGYFVTNLDFGDEFNGDKRYLQVGVRCPPDPVGSYITLEQRVDLSAAPYAIYAQSATSAQSAISANTATSAITATTAQNVTTVNWSQILNRPPGLDNGDNDALRSVCPIGTLYSGRVAKFDGGGGWLCKVDEDSDTLRSLVTQCITSEIAIYNGATWVCGEDENTTYSAGTGLDLTGSTFSILASYQLPAGCTNQFVPKWNDTDGEWDCAVDNSAAFTADEGIDVTALESNQIKVKVSDIAGDGLKDDGSNNLMVNTSDIIVGGAEDGLALESSKIKFAADEAAGVGLTADANNNLNLDSSELAGDGLENDGDNKLQLKTGQVNMRELEIPMGSNDGDFVDIGTGNDEVDMFPITGVSMDYSGKCLVIATGIIKSTGSATSSPHGYIRAAIRINNSVSAEPSNATTYFQNIEKMASATVSWVFSVSEGQSVDFGCRLSTSDNDWQGDEEWNCSVSYLCQ